MSALSLLLMSAAIGLVGFSSTQQAVSRRGGCVPYTTKRRYVASSTVVVVVDTCSLENYSNYALTGEVCTMYSDTKSRREGKKERTIYPPH